MNDFQPRIEDPPEVPQKPRKWESLRKFVRDAGGKWCVVAELRNAKKRERYNARSLIWSAFMRVQGYQISGFEITSAHEAGVYKVYARYIAANVMKSPQ